MSECNCCCAYLNPPWWVTMGFVPPGGYVTPGNAQSQTPPNTAPPSRANPSPPRSVVVSAPPAANPAQGQPASTSRGQPTARNPATQALGAVQLAGDVATGNVVGAITDLMSLLS